MVEKKELIEDTTLSNRVKSILIYQGNIHTVSQLLSADCEMLKKLRGMGAGALQEVKDYRHSLGKELINEDGPFSTKEKDLFKQNKKPLSFYGFSMGLCKILYQYNLFTLDDLIQYGSSVYHIDGLTKLRAGELEQILSSLGIVLNYQKNVSLKLLDQVASLDFCSLSIFEQDKILNKIKIKDLDGLDTRVKNAILFRGVTNLGELLKYSSDDIKCFRNMGSGSFEQLVSYLELYGLGLFTEEQLQKRKNDKKNQMIDEYNQLVFERQELMKRIQMLDYRIQRKELEIKSYDMDEKKLVRVNH